MADSFDIQHEASSSGPLQIHLDYPPGVKRAQSEGSLCFQKKNNKKKTQKIFSISAGDQH